MREPGEAQDISQHEFEALVERARALTHGGRRAVLGITGSPGAGKSHLAECLVRALRAGAAVGAGHDDEEWVVHLPMDGYHLSSTQLVRLGLADQKGSPATFDAHGYVELLRRIVVDDVHTVYAPTFDRALDEPVAATIAVTPGTRLVITEGNYLQLEDEPWPHARAAMSEVWFCDTDETRRLEQLVARHVRFGRSEAAAREWVQRSDARNAELVAATRRRADLIIPDAVLASVEWQQSLEHAPG